MSAIEEIQKKVLALPIDQRVFLAVSLLESLPLAGDERTESEELAEVERREMQIESGRALPVSDAEFWRNIEADATR